MNGKIDRITAELLRLVTGKENGTENFRGAYNIRSDSVSVDRKSTENIKITSKEGSSGLEVHIAPGTVGEDVYIPALVTRSNINDVAYNDFFAGKGADVRIIAGCGVHSDGEEDSTHRGIHRFFLDEGAKVVYLEKHIGTGDGVGGRIIDPVTEIYQKKDSYLEMETSQLGGVSDSTRYTKAVLEDGASLIVKESILTEGRQHASTAFDVELNGDSSGVHLISRSVAKDDSTQIYESNIIGNAKCSGHSECDAILEGNGKVTATPKLIANDKEAALVHEAAIGKIAGEQILKLQTLGLTEEEAIEAIIEGFLK